MVPHPTAAAILAAASAASAIVAAVFWWRSAGVQYPAVLHGPGGINSPNAVHTEPMLKAFNQSAKLNRLGALFSGIAAALAGGATLLGSW